MLLAFRQISHAFDIQIDKDVVRRVLAKHFRPESGDDGPSWSRLAAALVRPVSDPDCRLIGNLPPTPNTFPRNTIQAGASGARVVSISQRGSANAFRLNVDLSLTTRRSVDATLCPTFRCRMFQLHFALVQGHDRNGLERARRRRK